MSVRGGRSPRGRDDRERRVPLDDEHEYGYEYEHDDVGPLSAHQRGYGRRRPEHGRRRSGGLVSLLGFLVFAVVLGGIVLVGALALLRPLAANAVVDWAYDNPGALRLPFVSDLVRERLGPELDRPASNDPSEVEFEVVSGDTPRTLAPRLMDEGLIRDVRAFIYQATQRELTPKLQAGNFRLRRDMTPDQVITGLIENRIVITVVNVTFRESLRLEQVTAKIQTLGPPLTIDAEAFYELVSNPPAALIEDYPWLTEAGLPEGASLEGFLAPATYQLTPESTAEDLVRMMLQAFYRSVGEARMDIAEERGVTFYEILTLASIVEREAVLDEERPLIAGVYQNRLDSQTSAERLLNADPTVFFALDLIELQESVPFDEWRTFVFWKPPGLALADVALPEPLQGYNTYRVPGLPPGPICTPSLPSILAALQPDQEEGFRYFLAIPGGNGAHVFAKTLKEHNANRAQYGYQ
jgi:UPF0755 protein